MPLFISLSLLFSIVGVANILVSVYGAVPLFHLREMPCRLSMNLRVHGFLCVLTITFFQPICLSLGQ